MINHHDGNNHWVRCYPVMPGNVYEFEEQGPLSDILLRNWGSTSARLSRALRSFHSPLTDAKVTPWDAQHALLLRPMLCYVDEERGLREMCVSILDQFEQKTLPLLSILCLQTVHGDLNLGNALYLPATNEISGIIDFGDMSYTSLIADIAAMLTGLGLAHSLTGADVSPTATTNELLRMARVVLDGYQGVTPLEEEELSLLADLWMVRVCAEVVITSWRVSTGLEAAERSANERGVFERQLRCLFDLGDSNRAKGLFSGFDLQGDVTGNLVERRGVSIGPGSEPLSFGDTPLQVAYASSCWVIDSTGRKYLDCYNNVPCVGHAHPRVALAIARQAGKAVTNMRYLHPLAVTLAERLKAVLPPYLDTVFFVNSGSEANDLAWRISTSVTGQKGAMCTKHAYHGVSQATIALSPETAGYSGYLPEHVECWEPPDAYRGLYTDDSSFKAALDRMEAKGLRPAMVINDGVMQSDGVIQLTPEYVQSLHKLTKEAGAMWCADEVQGGHGRVGSHLWSFQKFGIEPDFVTMGKPMGNGHPVACCVTRRAIADQFVHNEGVFFSTFGGNPVSCAAAHAVLDVLEDEKVHCNY